MQPLVQLALIWVGVLGAVYLAGRTRLTPVLYYLAIGALFVNIGILPEQPHAFVRGFAEIGIILIMFAIGFEEQATNFLGSVKRSWGIALFGAIAPFSATYAMTWWFWHDFAVSLMAALAMTATAVSLTMVALRSEGLASSKAATRIMTSAVLDDIAALALLAVLIPVAQGGALPGVLEIGGVLVKVMLFFGLVSVLGVVVFPHSTTGPFGAIPILKHLSMRSLLGFEGGQYATLILMLLAVTVGLAAHAFGFHPAVGAYMAGLILREEYFDYADSGDKSNYLDVKTHIDSVAFTWIGPVFFVLLGTNLVFSRDLFVSLIPETLALTTALVVAQVTSAGLAARYTSDMRFAGSVLIGLGMLG